MKKLDKKSILTIIIGIIAIFVFLCYQLFFNETFLGGIYPYKVSTIQEQQQSIQKGMEKVNRYKKDIDLLSTQIDSKKIMAEQKQKEVQDLEQELLTDYQLDTKVDYGSLLIFLDNEASTNGVYISKLNLYADQNSNNNNLSNNNQTVQQNIYSNQTYQMSSSRLFMQQNLLPHEAGEEYVVKKNLFQTATIKMSVIGSYKNIKSFIDSIDTNIGKYHYIESYTLVRGQKPLFGNKNNTNEKNVIADLVIKINYKGETIPANQLPYYNSPNSRSKIYDRLIPQDNLQNSLQTLPGGNVNVRN